MDPEEQKEIVRAGDGAIPVFQKNTKVRKSGWTTIGLTSIKTAPLR